MYCPKCGSLNDNENIWCINCGHGKLPTVIPRNEEQPAENYTTDENIYSVSVEEEPVVIPEKKPQEENVNAESSYTASSDTKVHQGYKWDVRKKEIKDYFVWAILAAVFCSITFGTAAIIFSAMTKAEKASGNTLKAEVYSSKTKLFSIIALIVGVIKYIFVFLMIVIAAAGFFLPFYPYYF